MTLRSQTARGIVLGINAAHDASACLLVDGELVVGIPEERLSRTKHHRGFPQRAVNYCLKVINTTLADVDAIVINEPPATDFGLMLRQNGDCSGELIVNPSHHLLHAYYAIVASGMQRPAVLVIDGSGYSYAEHERRGSPLLGPAPPYSDMEEAESSYHVDSEGEIVLIEKRWALWEASKPLIRFPSLGHMYSAASQYIFGHLDHAGKTMGLAAYGDASRFPEPIINYGPKGLTIDTKWTIHLPPRSALAAHLDPVCRDLAAKVQSELESAVLFLCRRLHDLTDADELCISGGVGLNSVTNARILRETPFRRLFVTPASGDSGVAIGAALYGHHHLAGKRPSWQRYHNFHGKVYCTSEIAAAIEARTGLVRGERLDNLEQVAARDIAAGKFVGWFDGESEFGPRALGHRSIVCDPRPATMRDQLNAEVKFREPFRPYAASVLSEYASEYFQVVHYDPHMMTVANIVEQKRDIIPSVSHADGTCRIQIVNPDDGRYRRLIECFYQLSGVPLVLNTSFNTRGEPMVETPADALTCFLGCNLDVLYIGDYRITKIAAEDCSAEELVPHLNESISVHSYVATYEGTALEPRYYYESRTGYRGTLGPHEYQFLVLVNGKRSVAELQRLLVARGLQCDALEMATNLQRRGALAFKASMSAANSTFA